jgi:hypothetical protein
MNSASKFHIEALFDRLQEIHHQMVRDIETAERENVLVVCPFTLHQIDVEPFLFEKALLDRAEDRRFASNADVADADFIGSCRRTGVFAIATG